MCCLFGFVDYGHQLSRKQRSRLLSVLSTACEERGTDATGIAYNVGGKQVIYKRPLPAHLMWYRVPVEANIVMGQFVYCLKEQRKIYKSKCLILLM